MAQIAFWSPYHGQPGNTANTITAAIYTAMNYRIKTLIAHSHYNKSNLESAFLSGNESESLSAFEDVGIDALERLANSNQLNPEDIPNYTRTLISGRLELLSGTTKTYRQIFEQHLEKTILNILYNAKRAYELILVDVNSGNAKVITDKILEDSDFIVVSLNQNLAVLKSFFDKIEWHERLNEKKYIVVIGNYDARSKYSVRYIKKLFNYKDEIYTVPYNVEFRDAHNDHRVLDFFYANNDVDTQDANYNFISEVDKLTQKMLELAQIDVKYKRKTTVHKSLLDSLRRFIGA